MFGTYRKVPELEDPQTDRNQVSNQTKVRGAQLGLRKLPPTASGRLRRHETSRQATVLHSSVPFMFFLPNPNSGHLRARGGKVSHFGTLAHFPTQPLRSGSANPQLATDGPFRSAGATSICMQASFHASFWSAPGLGELCLAFWHAMLSPVGTWHGIQVQTAVQTACPGPGAILGGDIRSGCGPAPRGSGAPEPEPLPLRHHGHRYLGLSLPEPHNSRCIDAAEWILRLTWNVNQ
ncbi:hypothetical protein DFH27DRAFT_524008 [Peziza echinospora]|nr:hypothetical protein DFH27DRAFT_524008 [Peziza echinospora]